jgi:hypothetical protein
MSYWTLVRVPPFLFVFQDFPGLRIHTNFLRHGAALNIERIAQAAPALFFLQFFISDFAGIRL